MHPRIRRAAFVVPVLIAFTGLAGCAAVPPAATGTGTAPTGTAAETPTGTDASGAGSPVTLDGILARFGDCEAIGAVLGADLDGMTLDSANAYVDADGISCMWLTEDAAETLTVAIDPNGGADDLATPDILAMIGSEQVSDAGVEAAGGIAYTSKTDGDLGIGVTIVEVPGVTASITQGVLGGEPTLIGATAVTPAKQLLGIG